MATASTIFTVTKKRIGYFIMSINKKFQFQKITPDLFQSAFDKIIRSNDVYFKKHPLSESENLQEYWRVFAIHFASALNDMFYSKFKSLPNVLDVVLPEFDKQSKCVYSFNNSALSSFDLEKSESTTKNEYQCFIMYDIGFKIPLRKSVSQEVLYVLKQEYESSNTYTAQFIRVICPTTGEPMTNALFNHDIEYSICYDEENKSLHVRMKNVQ